MGPQGAEQGGGDYLASWPFKSRALVWPSLPTLPHLAFHQSWLPGLLVASPHLFLHPWKLEGFTVKSINNCLNSKPLCMLTQLQEQVQDGFSPSLRELAEGFLRPPTFPNLFLILAAEMSPLRESCGPVLTWRCGMSHPLSSLTPSLSTWKRLVHWKRVSSLVSYSTDK